jgi:acyl-coenzyme A synthetase/AMP-(fatty) acid ligase
MIRDCGVNRLNQFATFLAQHLRNSRQNPRLLALLQTLDDALYSGLALPREEEEWAHGNGIRLRVSLVSISDTHVSDFHKNLFGSTECGAMLLSTRGSEMLLQPLDGMSYAFLPTASQSEAGTSQAGHSCAAPLLELVILAESPDCPDSSFRAADGHFHTGDLFQEARPGYYLSLGRDDDWIKSENSLRCDTKYVTLLSRVRTSVNWFAGPSRITSVQLVATLWLNVSLLGTVAHHQHCSSRRIQTYLSPS